MMGRAASAADVTILTSDNPRSEDPDQILRELTGGAGPDVILEVDRQRAIERAIDAAEEGDVVLILGKGHETGQEIGGEVHPFDDRTVAREILAARGGSTDSGPGSGSMSR
jgi:UDP-N-acetylmuramoyl-L-alanyl-D-glutamate--2,6-diaminopimelate ligase